MLEATDFLNEPSRNETGRGHIYGEHAVWLCKNKKTGFNTRINGVLAQILKKYPKDYRLKLLKVKELLDEYRAPAG